LVASWAAISRAVCPEFVPGCVVGDVGIFKAER
jgi:hypothetical protein